MELRKDYLLNRFVILSTGRGKRPREFKQKRAKIKIDKCFFCPGKEHLTPPEIGRIEKKGKWLVRWFPNKFPAVELKGNYTIKTDNDYFTFSDSYGKHEVIVETPDHKKQLGDLSEVAIKDILKVYSDRIQYLSKLEGIKYVCIFKNHGEEAGTSIVHTHTQVIAINQIPALVKEEMNANKGKCRYCDIINIEKGSFRRCFENESFVAFTPYASRFHFEIWIFSKEHIKNIADFDEKKYSDLAEIMKKILVKLKTLNAPYNFFLHYAPDGHDLHFHIEVCPRLAKWAGFEFSSNIVINSLTPEDAAKFYRGEE